MTGRSKLMLATIAVAGTLAAAHPNIDLRVLTHRMGDPSPHRVQAALDTGLVAVSILVTWTAAGLSR